MHKKVTHTDNAKMMALICLIVNLIVCPGLGTMIAGVIRGDEYMMPGIVIGLLQFFTAMFLVGWIWAIYTSYCQIKNSKDA